MFGGDHTFSNMYIDSELLIALVKERPVLWDTTLAYYREKSLTSIAWNEICISIYPFFGNLEDRERSDCRRIITKKWTSLKDNWMISLRRIEDQKFSGQGVARPYIFSNQMAFLKDVMYPNVSHNNNSQVDNSFESSLRSTTFDIMDVQLNLNVMNTTDNRHVSFFKSLLPSLESLDENEILDFQIDVLNIIKDIRQKRFALHADDIYSRPNFGSSTQNNEIHSTSVYSAMANVTIKLEMDDV